MRIFALSFGVLVIFFTTTGMHGQVPKGLVDFDRSVGFSQPRNITVYPSGDTNELVFLMPNGLAVAHRSDGNPRIGLTHTGIGRDGDLVLGLTPAIDGIPIQEIVADLKAQYPSLHFAIPGAKTSHFEIQGPGVSIRGVSGRAVGDPIAGTLVYNVHLEPLAVRVLLAPLAYHMAVFAVSVDYDVKGISRDTQGSQNLETRTFRVSNTIEGFCALFPRLVINAIDGSGGCVHPHYPPGMVRAIQIQLQADGENPGSIDGRFGSNTERAIRRVQAKNRLPVDGVPTAELLEFLTPSPQSSKRQ